MSYAEPPDVEATQPVSQTENSPWPLFEINWENDPAADLQDKWEGSFEHQLYANTHKLIPEHFREKFSRDFPPKGNPRYRFKYEAEARALMFAKMFESLIIEHAEPDNPEAKAHVRTAIKSLHNFLTAPRNDARYRQVVLDHGAVLEANDWMLKSSTMRWWFAQHDRAAEARQWAQAVLKRTEPEASPAWPEQQPDFALKLGGISTLLTTKNESGQRGVIIQVSPEHGGPSGSMLYVLRIFPDSSEGSLAPGISGYKRDK
ncbi:MAG: hypothetical protein AAGI68_08820 [Planctomycetota bacterium]